MSGDEGYMGFKKKGRTLEVKSQLLRERGVALRSFALERFFGERASGILDVGDREACGVVDQGLKFIDRHDASGQHIDGLTTSHWMAEYIVVVLQNRSNFTDG